MNHSARGVLTSQRRPSSVIEAGFSSGIPRTVKVPHWKRSRDVSSRHIISDKSKDRLSDRKYRSDATQGPNQRAEMPDTGSIDLMRQSKYSMRSMLTTSSGGKAGIVTQKLGYCVFFSLSTCWTCAINSSEARRLSRLSRPRVTMDLGSRSANKYLQTLSMTQQPIKSITIDAVRRSLNCTGSAENHEVKGSGTNRIVHLNDLQPSIEFGDKICRPRKGNTAGANQTPVQSAVLPNAFTERPSLHEHVNVC